MARCSVKSEQPGSAASSGRPARVVHVGDVGAAIKDTALKLLKVDSNLKNGVAYYKDGVAALRKLIEAVPASDGRERATQLLGIMERSFNSKTNYTWKPYVIAALRSLGVISAEEVLPKFPGSTFVTPETVTHAEGAVAKALTGKDPKFLGPDKGRKKPKTELALALKAKPEAADRRSGLNPQLKAEKAIPKAGLKRERASGLQRVKQEGEAAAQSAHPASSSRAGGRRSGSSKTPPESTAVEEKENAPPAEAAQDPLPPGKRRRAWKMENIKKEVNPKAESDPIERFTPATAEGPEDRIPLPDQYEQAQHDAHADQNDSPDAEQEENVPAVGKQAHFAALELREDASYDEIRAAYRRRVLATHPDKGGSAQDFRRVQLAWEVLSECCNVAAQAASRASSRGDVADSVAARVAFAYLLMARREAWDRFLASIDAQVLQALVLLIKSNIDQPSHRQKKREEANAEEKYESSGLRRLATGTWLVQVGWRNWKVQSSFADFEQAVNVHIALCEIRNAARARHKKMLDELVALGCDRKAIGDLDGCPVMTPTELLTLLEEEPFNQLLFCTDFSTGKGRVARFETTWTPSFDNAVHFREVTNRARHVGGFRGCLATLKERQKEQAKKDKEARIVLLRDAATRVQQEAARRGQTAPCAEEPKPVLALKETSAAAELARLQATLEAERQGFARSIEHAQESSALVLAQERSNVEMWRMNAKKSDDQLEHAMEMQKREAQRADHFAENWERAQQRSEDIEDRCRRLEDERQLEREKIEAEKHALVEAHEAQKTALVEAHEAQKTALVEAERAKPPANPHPFFGRSRSRYSEMRADRFVEEGRRAARRCAPSAEARAIAVAKAATCPPTALEPYEVQGAIAAPRWRPLR